MNAAEAFTRSPLPGGNRVSMIANSGGFSVIQTDLTVAEGLAVPKFSEDTLQQLRKLVPLAGTSIGNPLDAWPIFYKVSQDGGNLADIVKVVVADPAIDSLVFMFDQFRYLRRGLGSRAASHMDTIIRMMLEGSAYGRDVLGKPVFLAVSLDPFLQDEEDRTNNLKLKDAFAQAGYPVFSSSEAAVKALGALYKYARLTGRLPG